jgi:hypothetical protein
MPATFDSTKLEPHCFVANSSSPAQLSGLDRKASDELIRVFVENLKKNFSVPANPENFLARDNTANVDAKDPEPPQTYIVIGSSIMGKVAGHLRSLGLNVIDLSIPGWVATSENVEGLVARLSALKNVENFAIVLDLHSNSTFRFLQFDGTLALPVKEGKKYHYPGELRTVTDDIYKKITAGLQTVLLSAQKNIKILIPPLPRYVFCKCCGNPAHVTNFEQDRYKEKILDSCTHLRNTLKKQIGEMGVEKYWVLDGLGAIMGVESGTDRGSNRELLADMEQFMAGDGVHLSEPGYRNIARVIVSTATAFVSGKLGKNKFTNTSISQGRSYYWRGFISPVGSARQKSNFKSSRSWKQRTGSTPYGSRPGR